MIFYDSETTGLSPHFDRITLHQTMIDGEPTLWRHSAPPYKDDVLVIHNASFDLAMLDYTPDISMFEDTLLLSKLAAPGAQSHSLDAVLTRVLGRNPYAGMSKKAMQKSDWSGELTQEQMNYAITDVRYLHKIVEAYQDYLTDPIYLFDKQSVIAGLKVQKHGLPVLKGKVEARIQEQSQLLEDTLAGLWFNPNSPKQVCQELGLESSSDQTLAYLEDSEPAQAVRQARSLRKEINFLEKLIANPRYYGTLKPHAKSGRFTSSNENIQQIPRSMKKFIGSQDKVIISSDYAQLEMRTVAILSQDEVLLELFSNGTDLHDYSAQQLFGDKFTKEDRQVAKIFNFASIYGSGAATIRNILAAQTGIIKPEEEVAALKKLWLQAFPGIRKWQKLGGRRHDSGEICYTPMGRPYLSTRFTENLNIENQGFGAEVARLALHYAVDNMPPGARVINFVHDAILVEADMDVHEQAADVLVEAMCHGWSAHPQDKLGLTMPVAAGVAQDWAAADTEKEAYCIYVARGEA
jgi:DNA polymerase I-like protein with 3'-5' exonuclease and polymerase domains